ncbi:terpene cyclase [Taiwanofungus camphoratus]|nr:terpene cyclase [Antrodia cinnamomea]KAI0948720.1 terpene cyclase [Antrodia cinnamomea]
MKLWERGNRAGLPLIEKTTLGSSVDLPGIPSDQESLVYVSQQAIQDFLERIRLTLPKYERDVELETRVKQVTQSWDNELFIRPNIVSAIIFTTTAYSHISSSDTKLHIALFVSLLTSLDDPTLFASKTVYDLHQKLCTGSAQNNPDMLGRLTRLLAGMWDHFPKSAANPIFVSTLRWINGTVLENESQDMILTFSALSFIEYRRSMSGAPEAFAAFIWEKARFPDVSVYVQAIPDALLYINYVNDILSFYKEELQNETGNYIQDRAAVTGRSALETLREVINDTVVAMGRIRAILGEGEARDAWESFAKGYISSHFVNPRYRLRDVFGDQYLIDVASY